MVSLDYNLNDYIIKQLKRKKEVLMLNIDKLINTNQKQLVRLKIVNNNTIKGCEAEIAKLHQFEKQGQYCHLFSLINITEPLLSNWQKLINAQNTAIVLANNISETVKVYDDVEGTLWHIPYQIGQKSYDNFSIINECICNHFTDFISALLTSKAFKDNKYTLHERVFLLDACSGFGTIELDNFENDNTNLALYCKHLLKTMFDVVFKHYSELDEEERQTVSDVANEVHYQQGSFECIASGFFDDNFANREFTCYDNTDLNTLVHAYSITTNFKALITNTDHMHLGKCRKLVVQECQKQHHEPIYDVLNACAD